MIPHDVPPLTFQGRKYLNYDLEALHAYLKTNPRRHIVIAFQDSEAFESGLLSDLISLFRSVSSLLCLSRH